MVINTEVGFDGDDHIPDQNNGYKNDALDGGSLCSYECTNIEIEKPLAVIFPPMLGRFENSIEFGSVGPYWKTLCKNLGDVEIEQKFSSPEIIHDYVQDDKNDDNITCQEAEAEVMDENPGDTNNTEEILNLETEPKCEIICDNDEIDDNISFQGVEEIDDVERVGIHVIDDETKEDDISAFEDEKLNEQIKNAEMQLDENKRCRDAIRAEIQTEKAKLKADNKVLNAANLEIKAAKRLCPYWKTLCKNLGDVEIELKFSSPKIIHDDVQDDDKNDDNITCQEAEVMDENPGDINNMEEISNLETEPKCEIICDDDKNDDNISFQGIEEIDDVESVGIHVIDDETKEDDIFAFEDEKLNEQTKNAEMQLDEKTRCRDAIRAEIQTEMAKLKADNEVLNAAKLEIKAAKRLGPYWKTLCKNLGDVEIELKFSSPKIIHDDVQDDDKNDDNITCQEAEVMDENPGDINNMEEISNLETEPKCEIICDDDKNDDNISFQGIEELDDVESVGIHVIDDETKEDDIFAFEDEKLNEQTKNAEMQLDEKTRCRDAIRAEIQTEKAKLKADNEVLNAAKLEIKAAKRLGPYWKTLCKNLGDVEIELECSSPEIIHDDVQDDDKNDDNITCQEAEVMDENPGDTNNMEEISNLETEPKCEIICDDDKNDDDISFQGIEEIDDVESVGIHVIDDETKEDDISAFEDEKLNEQIKNAVMQLDEKTRCRDAIRAEIQMEKAKLKADNEVLNAANLEIKAAKRLVTSKRQEIDYVQCVINKIKNAISIEDINSKILEVGRIMEYETLWLKEENQFIREIKQLKSMHDRLASNMGSQDEIHLALLQKDKIDELLKNLKKEMKSLKDNVSKTEVAARAIRKTYKEKNEKGKELQAKYIAADELRQEAYGHLSSLKKLLYSKDTLDQQPLCVFFDEDKSVSAVLKVETEKTVLFVEEKLSGDQNWEKVERKNKQVMKMKETVKPTEVIENKVKEKMIRKFVELKNEAMEMEKQNAENDGNQAEMQVQKESEQKEKARLKRLRKKERKIAGSVTSSNNNIDIGDISESKEIENTIGKPQQHSPPHFMPKQLKPKIISSPLAATLSIQNQKWLWRHWGKMINVAAIVILAALSLRNIDFSTLL